VDRAEPHRAVDVEHPDPVEQRADVRMPLLEQEDRGRVDPLLRDQRTGDRGDRQQEQQDERRPHRGELAPGPAQELPRTEGRRRPDPRWWWAVPGPALRSFGYGVVDPRLRQVGQRVPPDLASRPPWTP